MQIQGRAIQERREDRIDILVRATMHAPQSAGVVRLCNISPIGALIEGSDLPAVGSNVELQRGALSVSGKVVWLGDDQAGVSFEDRITVQHWLPNAEPQRAVDRAFQRIMQEMRGQDNVQAMSAPLHGSQITADDMERSAGALEELADALACEPELFARYATQLQSLDVAAQMLRKLALRED